MKITTCPDCSKRFEEGDDEGILYRMFPALDSLLDPDGLGKCVSCWNAAAITHIRITEAVEFEFKSQRETNTND